jgi:hypothetical protein
MLTCSNSYSRHTSRGGLRCGMAVSALMRFLQVQRSRNTFMAFIRSQVHSIGYCLYVGRVLYHYCLCRGCAFLRSSTPREVTQKQAKARLGWRRVVHLQTPTPECLQFISPHCHPRLRCQHYRRDPGRITSFADSRKCLRDNSFLHLTPSLHRIVAHRVHVVRPNCPTSHGHIIAHGRDARGDIGGAMRKSSEGRCAAIRRAWRSVVEHSCVGTGLALRTETRMACEHQRGTFVVCCCLPERIFHHYGQ